MMLLEMLLGANTPTGSQTFTSSGSFVVPNNTGYISAVAIGGGGATGSNSGGPFPNIRYGGGGAGGALVYGNNIPVVPGEVLTVTVGQGGSTAGINGGYSEISRGATVLMRANGGQAGSSGNSLYGTTTPATSANIGGYPYNQAGGDGGGAGYAFTGGPSGGGGAGGYSGSGGTGGTETTLSYSTGTVYLPYTVNATSVGGATYYFVQGPFITTTTDFVTFTPQVNSGSTLTNILREPSFGNHIVCGLGGLLYTGVGSSWTSRSSGTSSDLYGILRAEPGVVFVGGASGTLIVTTNPNNFTSWTSVSSGTSETILCGHSPTTGAYAMMGGSNGLILLRTDPFPLWTGTWTVYSTGGTDAVKSITDNGSIYVAVGQNGSIYTSTNQTSWTARTSGTSNYLYKVLWYASYFWVVGANGTLLRSADGITWTSLSLGFSGTITSILSPDILISSNILYQTGVVPMAGDSGAWLNSYLTINSTGSSGTGGAAGGGSGANFQSKGGGGGGTGLLGVGSSGTGGTYGGVDNANGGGGGSGGNNGTIGGSGPLGGFGGLYGGGGGGSQNFANIAGANGAVRIIWGRGKSFPSNAS